MFARCLNMHLLGAVILKNLARLKKKYLICMQIFTKVYLSERKTEIPIKKKIFIEVKYINILK